jgi:P4 family phage/plasmid primase-like protien
VLASAPADRTVTEAIADVDLDAAIEDGLGLLNVSTSERLKRATKYLAKMPPAVSGAGGHPTTFKAALSLVRGFAIDPALAFVLLRDEYNPRCQPRWSDKELRHKIDGAVKDTKTPLGALLRKKQKPMGAVPDQPVQADESDGATPKSKFTCTDLGNAERLVHQHGQDLRYCAPWEKWLVWSSARWQVANKKQVERFAQVTARSIYKEAAAESDPDRRKVLAEHAKQSESNARKVAMIEQAKSLPGIPILPEELDAKPWLLNVQNGTIDLKTGALREHCRDDLLTKLGGTSYDPEAKCPLYDTFLARVLPDEQVRDLVNRLDGYALTGVVQDHVFPIHYGGGRNGKGVHTNVLLHVWGDYARQISTELLVAKRGDSHPTEKTTLFGTRLAVAVETEENRALNVAFVKQATGGDRISARRMREDFWEFDPVHKLQLSTNHRPTIRETKDAIWDRVLLVPWTVKIPESERDPLLGEKLKTEAPGILAKLVRACLVWQKGGLAIPKAVRVATEQFRSDMDVLGKFIADCCIVEGGAEEGATPLFESFIRWAETNNERELSQTVFGTQLGERGFANKRDSKTGRKAWAGLRLREGVSLGQPGATDTCVEDVSDADLESLFDAPSKGTAEQSEQSEPTFRLVTHESHILAETGNAVQTIQTVQAAAASPQNPSLVPSAAGSLSTKSGGDLGAVRTSDAARVTLTVVPAEPSTATPGSTPHLHLVTPDDPVTDATEPDTLDDDLDPADLDAELDRYRWSKWQAEA